MFCTKCGIKLPDGVVFCPYCGERVADIEKQSGEYKTVRLSDVMTDRETNTFKMYPEPAPNTAFNGILFIKPGTVLHARYTVEKVLGSGGFGITYLSTDNVLDKKVAVKEFFPNNLVTRNNTVSVNVECITSGEIFQNEKKKVLKEARVLAKFANTPGVVTVHDYFEENNTAYIVMEYIDGGTLRDAILKRGVMTPDHAYAVLAPIMKVVSKLHSENVIHRDISPENIMLDENMPKLLDFGAARELMGETGDGLSVILKHGYAPQEQYSRKGKQGPWTDVYSMCATLYFCITGKTPDSAFDRIQADELAKPSELGISISPSQEDALMRGLAVFPKDRIKNIDELTEAWNRGADITPADRACEKAPDNEPEPECIRPPEKPEITEQRITGTTERPVSESVFYGSAETATENAAVNTAAERPVSESIFYGSAETATENAAVNTAAERPVSESVFYGGAETAIKKSAADTTAEISISESAFNSNAETAAKKAAEDAAAGAAQAADAAKKATEEVLRKVLGLENLWGKTN